MNVRKHLIGFALFSVILGSAIIINYFLSFPKPPVALPKPPVSWVERPQPISYEVRQVSLDFINDKSYTELRLELPSGQLAPEKLWVTTYYFLPGSTPREGWTSTQEIRQPFARSDRVNLVVTSSCEPCASLAAPRSGYFARVYVSTEYPVNSPSPDEQFNRDVTKAVPVVVHWPKEAK